MYQSRPATRSPAAVKGYFWRVLTGSDLCSPEKLNGEKRNVSGLFNGTRVYAQESQIFSIHTVVARLVLENVQRFDLKGINRDVFEHTPPVLQTFFHKI